MDENDYLDLFEQSPALLLVLDTKFNIVTATDAYLKVTMTERKNIVGRNMFDVFPDNPSNKNSEAITNVKASLIRVLKSKVTDIMQVQKHDIRKPESEGGEFEERFWSPVNSPILDKNNNVKYIIHRVEDVTQNKELISTNQKLRESYDFSKAIIATIHETMLVLKKDFKVKSASKSFYKKFLVTKETTKGKSIFELENGIWDIPEIHELLQTTATDKANVDDLEIKITFPHIGEKSMLVNANPIIKKNQDKQLILFTIKDITEVRRLGFALQSKEKRVLEEQLDIEKKALKKIEDSEKRYNMMLMESPFAIAILKGKDMVVTLANASIKEIWGKGNNVEGKKFIDILPELKDLSFPLLLDEVYSTGIPFYGYELPVPLVRDGKIVNEYFNFVYQPYHEADKTVSGVTIIASDVTTQVSAKNELIEAKIKAEQKTKIAEEAVKSKQQFLSNMSHEIRTPMNAIIGFTNVVLKTDLDESQKEYINAIKESGDALIVLINDILDIAKVDAGKMTFEKTAFSLSNSIATMLHLFEAKIVEKKLELHHDYDATIPLNVIGDPMRLRQIILNLMSNAVKFTSKGKIAICLRLVDQDTEKVTIEFLITDTGIGIPKNRLADIFNNFEQATVGTSNSFGGTGLGLAIAKQLVELQGGTITVNSEEGKGSDFSFVLTFDKIKSEVKAIKEEVKLFQEIPQETRTTGKVKVLVAEDIALNQLLIKIILLDFGYEIDMANNGKEAVEKLQKNTYDIILMDLQMPVMNGFEATRYIRNELNSNIPIIALTADVTSVDVEKCKAAGMNDYVSKPIDEKILYNKIIGCLKESNTIK